MTVAERLAPLVRASLGPDVEVAIDCWDGSSLGPKDAPARIRFTSRRALRRLLWQPNELGFARAYVSGDVQIDGDLVEALTELDKVSDPNKGPSIRIGPDTVDAIGRAVLRVGALGPPPRPPAEEIRLSGRRHSQRRDARAVSHHYDVGNDFYALVLGPSMVYACAYYEQAPSPAYPLEDAQLAKPDLVARKLGLRPGMRVLDVGCGWGAFVQHAARHYGVSAVGVTLSGQQANYAQRQVAHRLAQQVTRG